jgi:UDP-glucose 4-epimerase
MSVIWITGAKGFIGSHLSRYFTQPDNEIFGIGHGFLSAETINKLGLSFWLNGQINGANLTRLFEKSGLPKFIFHLAGGSSVGFSVQFPSDDFSRSVCSTAELLEWVRINTPSTTVIFSSSAAVYGNCQLSTIPVNGNYTPCSPYGFHKRSAELLCQSYNYNFQVKVAIVRLFSVYGPHLYKQLLWDLCGYLNQSSEVLRLHGTGQEIRDWLFVEDAVRLLVAAGNYASTFRELLIINGGTGIGTCVRDVANKVCQIWGYSPQLEFSNENRIGDPFSLVADITSLKTIDFIPQYQLNDGLEKYVHWFQQVKKS